jgi:hypothetical protein
MSSRAATLLAILHARERGQYAAERALPPREREVELDCVLVLAQLLEHAHLVRLVGVRGAEELAETIELVEGAALVTDRELRVGAGERRPREPTLAREGDRLAPRAHVELLVDRGDHRRPGSGGRHGLVDSLGDVVHPGLTREREGQVELHQVERREVRGRLLDAELHQRLEGPVGVALPSLGHVGRRDLRLPRLGFGLSYGVDRGLGALDARPLGHVARALHRAYEEEVVRGMSIFPLGEEARFEQVLRAARVSDRQERGSRRDEVVLLGALGTQIEHARRADRRRRALAVADAPRAERLPLFVEHGELEGAGPVGEAQHDPRHAARHLGVGEGGPTRPVGVHLTLRELLASDGELPDRAAREHEAQPLVLRVVDVEDDLPEAGLVARAARVEAAALRLDLRDRRSDEAVGRFEGGREGRLRRDRRGLLEGGERGDVQRAHHRRARRAAPLRTPNGGATLLAGERGEALQAAREEGPHEGRGLCRAAVERRERLAEAHRDGLEALAGPVGGSPLHRAVDHGVEGRDRDR